MGLKLKVYGVFGGLLIPIWRYKSQNFIGYTLDDGESLIALDAGSWKMLKDEYVLENLDTILLSHTHPDHTFHLGKLAKAAKKEIKIYAPQKSKKNKLGVITKIPKRLHGYTLEYFQTNHTKKNYCYKLTKEGKSICYTGDTGYFDELAGFCKGVDLLICEVTFNDSIRRPDIKHHMTPSKVAKLAAESNPKQLMLTHFNKARPKDAAAIIKKEFDNVIIAYEGLEIIV